MTRFDEKDGRVYHLVPRSWIIFIIVVLVIGFILFLLGGAVVIDNKRTADDLSKIAEKVIKRSHADYELRKKWVEVSQWNYEQSCQREKHEGKDCLPNPQWWLDPELFPDLADDPIGEGLFLKK